MTIKSAIIIIVLFNVSSVFLRVHVSYFRGEYGVGNSMWECICLIRGTVCVCSGIVRVEDIRVMSDQNTVDREIFIGILCQKTRIFFNIE